jgi:succinate dehydrogenase/fumarate reductase flavoprotein subunit
MSQNQLVKADVLCIGGGPAGLMAAIRAAEIGAKVVIAEKGNTIHSGSATGGCDHFMCYNPEYHGSDPAPIREAARKAPTGGITDPEYLDLWINRSFEMVKLWQSWGIEMKYKGKWDFGGHSFPNIPRIHMHYTGGGQKKVLTDKALQKGVTILNRVTVFELLKDKERVIGALGYDTWNDKFIQFEAKTIHMGTGACSRLYPSMTPGWLFNIPIPATLTGDGRAMTLRAGGDLVGLESTARWAGPKYFSRSGKGTWIGVYREPSGKPVGPFISKPNPQTGDITADVYPALFAEYKESARGPVYMTCQGATKEDMEYMYHWLRNEGNGGLLNHLDEEGIDPLKHGIEFSTYEYGVKGGVWHTVNTDTSIKGLYASGEEYAPMGGMTGAVLGGWIAGEKMVKYAKTVDFVGLKGEKEKIESAEGKINAMLKHTSGAEWEEANIALQNLMLDYMGGLRSEPLLDQGLANLNRLRKKANDILMASNGHEVGRCLEVLNLMDVGEAAMAAAKERKETRGPHKRVDFPFTNPLTDQMLLIRKVNGQFEFKYGKG